MRALVTGAGGFIGSHVVKQLVEQGVAVRALHLPKENLANLNGLDVELFEGDVTDAEAMARAVEGCRHVYHLAAVYALWTEQADLMHRVNVEGTRNVLQAAQHAGVERVIYTSSIAVFGGQGLDRDADETSSFALAQTADAYCRSKFDSHQIALDYARNGLDVTLVAPCGPLGPGDVGPTPTGRLILMALRSPVVTVPRTMTNMVDVRDVARGHLLAAERGERGRCYLLGNRNYWMADLVRLALKIAKRRALVVQTPWPVVTAAAHVAEGYADRVSRRAPLVTPAAVRVAKLGLRARCTRAVRELGLPQTNLAESLRDALLLSSTRTPRASCRTPARSKCPIK